MPRLRELLAGQHSQAVVWNLASLAVLSVAGVVLYVVIGRAYDAETLGVFQQTSAAWFVASQIAVAGIDRSTLRALAAHPHEPENAAAIVVGALASTAALALAVTAAYWLSIDAIAAWYEHHPGVSTGLAVSAPGVFFFAINKVLLAVVNGVQRMRAFAVYSALRYLLLLLGIVGFVVFDARREHGDRLAVVFTIGETALFVVLAIEVARQIAFKLARGWRAWCREHLRYGSKSVASGALLEINAYVDVAMIGHYMSNADVGIYTFASMFAQGAYQILLVLQNVYNPILAREIAGGRLSELAITARKGRIGTYLGMALVGAIAICLYPHVLVLLTDKPVYLASWTPFNLLMLGLVLASGYLPFAQTLLMSGHPGWHSIYMLACVLLNAAGNAILVPRLGLAGSAIATGGAMVISVIVLKAMVRRNVGLKL
jgi:O-antigen/teichoic acid export membrane protein